MNPPLDPAQRTEIYPHLEPFVSGHLALDSVHQMYWEVSGNPQGVPVLFLHGGPGAGASPSHRRFFDPDFYRIVIFDQRGSSRSRPLGETQNNTTQHLIADIERLREHLQVEKWIIFGGSWGSTLALAYAQAHPQCCSALVLRGIFLSRQSEIDWFLYGMRAFFPEAWHAFSVLIPKQERHDLLGAYTRRLDDPDPQLRVEAARHWSTYEGSCSTLLASTSTVAHYADDRVALGLARIEAHYFANGSFLEEDQLIAGIDRIRDLPCTIVQGRYDMICPIRTADELHHAWPEAEYVVVPDAGHSAWEPGISAQLVAAMERLKNATAK
ncbi:MAG: prolyl aminopeptidase [Betaproteobacteria bacterium]|nr:MAG: prolyl aminopeptidase [Betaproteobacteria bacterium]